MSQLTSESTLDLEFNTEVPENRDSSKCRLPINEADNSEGQSIRLSLSLSVLIDPDCFHHQLQCYKTPVHQCYRNQ